MKRLIPYILIILLILGFSIQAHAELQVLGTATAGYQLIYDTDLDITWYDYVMPSVDWDASVNWADNLVLDFGGHALSDWRLPASKPEWQSFICLNSTF